MLRVWRVCRQSYCKTLTSLMKRPTRCLSTSANLSANQVPQLKPVTGDAADDQASTQASDERTRDSYVMQVFEDRIHSCAHQVSGESSEDLQREVFSLKLQLSEQLRTIGQLLNGTSEDSPTSSDDSLSDREQRKADFINFLGEKFDEISMDFDQQKLKSLPPPTYAVEVSGLNNSATEADLMKIFGAYGRVKRINMHTDFRTREFQGHALVRFISEEAAGAAVEALDTSIFLGQCLKVVHKKDKTEKNQMETNDQDTANENVRASTKKPKENLERRKTMNEPKDQVTANEDVRASARTKKPKENLEKWKTMNEPKDQQESELDWVCTSCQSRNYSTRRVCRECATSRDKNDANKSSRVASERQDTRHNKRSNNADFRQQRTDPDDIDDNEDDPPNQHPATLRFQPRDEDARQRSWNNDFRGGDRGGGRGGDRHGPGGMHGGDGNEWGMRRGGRGRGGRGGGADYRGGGGGYEMRGGGRNEWGTRGGRGGRGGGADYRGRDEEDYDEYAPVYSNSEHDTRRERGGGMRGRGGRGARGGRDMKNYDDEQVGDYFEDHVRQSGRGGGMRSARGRGGYRSQDFADDDNDDPEVDEGEQFERDSWPNKFGRRTTSERNGVFGDSGVNEQGVEMDEWSKKLESMKPGESDATMEQLLAEERSIRSAKHSNDAYIEDDETEAFGRSENPSQEGGRTYSPFRGSSRSRGNNRGNNRYRGRARGKAY